MFLRRNLSKKYPGYSCLDSLKVNCCHIATPEMNGHFCSLVISDLIECKFFLCYNKYIQSVHLRNCTLNSLFIHVSDFYSCFLVIIRL